MPKSHIGTVLVASIMKVLIQKIKCLDTVSLDEEEDKQPD